MEEKRGMLDGFPDTPYGRWASLVGERNRAPQNRQSILGPLEHGAYAEYKVAQNPLNALIMLGLIPGYTASKALGIKSGRSPASIEEMSEAYKGMWRGLGFDWK
jgi:hypothetical protein